MIISYDPVYNFVFLICALQSLLFPLVYSGVIKSYVALLADCLGCSCVASFQMDRDLVLCNLSFPMAIVDV